MRRSNILEITAGLFVLIFTIFLIFFAIDKLSYIKKNYKDCYKIYGLFANANGIGVGDSVKISGVDVGSITGVSLDKATYVARIDMCISKDIKLPIDSSALITSSGVVGSKFVNISPGSDIKLILHGGKIEYTQAEANMGGIMDRILEATGLDDPKLAYEVRFLYPLFSSDEIYTTNNGDIFEQASHTIIPDINDIEVVKKGLNFNYSISHVKGSQSIIPIKVFDDGKFTYLQFNKINSDFPAVFMVDSAGYESLVNFRTADNYLIIERVSSVFTLRNGSSTVCLFNENMPFKKGK
ncbi:mgtE_N domain-containing protein [Trichonephila clavata]|uniref:MgtE_N domain-containing protein n=1 Tax=Trichonephila clavata TaxID=2740835 RepID=A0A8X6JZZ5_TRICU|nr:mgtE_N domain-containing protein [Trichonephila clavata]